MVRVVAERRCPKVLVTGTHSTGKSTLVAALAQLPDLPDVFVLGEAARNCPFELNKHQNELSTTWLLARQVLTEIELQTAPGAALVVCDRGVPDILAYYAAATGASPDDWMVALARRWLPGYDLVLIAEPDPALDMQADALRLNDAEFRLDIQVAIERTVAAHPGADVIRLPHDPAARLACAREAIARFGVSA